LNEFNKNLRELIENIKYSRHEERETIEETSFKEKKKSLFIKQTQINREKEGERTVITRQKTNRTKEDLFLNEMQRI
jgi:hypothetical protein